MKTYAEVITHKAEQVLGAYLGGSNDTRVADAGIIGFIYGVEERDVDIDIDEEFIRLLKDNK